MASAESNADFVLAGSDRAVSVLCVRDPECRLADQAKGAPLSALGCRIYKIIKMTIYLVEKIVDILYNVCVINN